MRRCVAILAVACCSAALWGSSAQAQSAEDLRQARRLRADAAYLELQGDIEEAIVQYKESLKYLPDDRIVAKIAEMEGGAAPEPEPEVWTETPEADPEVILEEWTETPEPETEPDGWTETPEPEVWVEPTEPEPEEWTSESEDPWTTEEPQWEEVVETTPEPVEEVVTEAIAVTPAEGEWIVVKGGSVTFSVPSDWQKNPYEPACALIDEDGDLAGMAAAMPLDIMAEMADDPTTQSEKETVTVSGRAATRLTILRRESEDRSQEGYALIFDEPLPCGTKTVLAFGLPQHKELFGRILATVTVSEESDPAEAARATQKDLARQLFKEISAADEWDLDTIETLYLRLIEEAPDTPQAEEAYWRMGNMYVQAFSPARKADAIALLERYLERYPESALLDNKFAMFAKPGMTIVEGRLLFLYEDENEWEKAAALYEKVIPDPAAASDEQLEYLPGYARTMEQTDRREKAIEAYTVFLERTDAPDSFLAQSAREDLEALKGPAVEPEE